MDLALFDFDGTLTTREMMPAFMEFAVRPRRLAWGKLLLAPMVTGYRLGLVSGTRVRAAIVRYGFRGVPLEELQRAGERFARDALPQALRDDAMQRIAWHRGRGDTVAVVSGALDVYLAPWCREQGLALLCSSLAHVDGVLTGEYRGRQCVLEEKAQRVREAYDLAGFGAVYAYGDTPEDRDLLALARHRFYRGRETDELP